MLENLDNKKIFTYFEEISNVPRGSFHNEKISGYLVDFARKHGLEYRVDEALNVVIKKPASVDCKTREPVMLQGHMDMVCVSEDGSHDFENEGLKLQVEGDYIEAEGTTLGGDDGIALAYVLAVLDSDAYTHPPIEAVFTTDEEVGMEGASALEVSDLKAKRLINLDNEEEGVLLVSCAGGATAQVTFSSPGEEMEGQEIEISVEGLTGGHSGTEIARHPLNASVFLGRLLYMAWNQYPFQLISFEGGDKDNVITRQASARLMCREGAEELIRVLKKYGGSLTEECRGSEPEAVFDIGEPRERKTRCFSENFTENILRFLNLTITGVQGMSSDVPGMVESSLNMGIARTQEDSVLFGFSVRSQKETYRDYMLHQLQWLAECVSSEDTECRFEVRGKYPAWDYRRDSVLREIMVEEFKKIFGREPRVEGIHAGLECGILSEKIPGLDIVSVGPEIMDIHTVNEKLCISSAIKNFDFLIHVLKRLAE